MAPDGQTTTYRRPSVSIGMGLDGADYSYLTKKTADSTGFFITFNIPFKRTDVFTELLSDTGQLGADGESGVTYTILKPGREQGKLVRRAPHVPAHVLSTAHAALALLTTDRRCGRASLSHAQVSSGCVREAVYTSPVWGRTITELREIKAPAYIRWSTLMQEGTLFQFTPKQDDNPKVQIALKEV